MPIFFNGMFWRLGDKRWWAHSDAQGRKQGMPVWVLSMGPSGQSSARRGQDSSSLGRRRWKDVLFCHLAFPNFQLETVFLPGCQCVTRWGVLFWSTLHSTEVEASAHGAQWAWGHRPVTPASWEPEAEGWQVLKGPSDYEVRVRSRSVQQLIWTLLPNTKTEKDLGYD